MPYPLILAGDGDLVFDGGAPLTEMGGNFIDGIEYMCSHQRSPAVEIPNDAFHVGMTGFRLIRRL